jgi:hypothetical protein
MPGPLSCRLRLFPADLLRLTTPYAVLNALCGRVSAASVLHRAAPTDLDRGRRRALTAFREPQVGIHAPAGCTQHPPGRRTEVEVEVGHSSPAISASLTPRPSAIDWTMSARV